MGGGKERRAKRKENAEEIGRKNLACDLSAIISLFLQNLHLYPPRPRATPFQLRSQIYFCYKANTFNCRSLLLSEEEKRKGKFHSPLLLPRLFLLLVLLLCFGGDSDLDLDLDDAAARHSSRDLRARYLPVKASQRAQRPMPAS
jgi:hypothetical protein